MDGGLSRSFVLHLVTWLLFSGCVARSGQRRFVVQVWASGRVLGIERVELDITWTLRLVYFLECAISMSSMQYGEPSVSQKSLAFSTPLAVPM